MKKNARLPAVEIRHRWFIILGRAVCGTTANVTLFWSRNCNVARQAGMQLTNQLESHILTSTTKLTSSVPLSLSTQNIVATPREQETPSVPT